MKVNRKEREYQLRRELIIDVSEQLFYERGYENVTLGDIARAADYTKKTLYSYITGKGDLYLEVYCRGLEKRRLFIEESMAEAETGLAKIEALGKAYFEFFEANPQMLLLVQYFDYRGIEYDKVDEEVVNKFISINKEANLQHLEAFKLGKKDGSINPEIQTEIIYSQFIHCLRTITHNAIWGKAEFDTSEQKEKFTQEYFHYFLNFYLRGISNHPEKLPKFKYPLEAVENEE
ncbi:MAG: TetR/AcrR family transcriptional regulator [Candidatus Cloacimonetes bacterium]|nr:TetR/AcrR family transcriptional regulator [Candidatus Cloacimonadota bacterium]